MLTEYALKKGLDLALSSLRQFLDTKRAQITPADQIELALAHHQSYVANWSKAAIAADGRSSKALADVSIDLDTHVYPRRARADANIDIPRRRFIELVEHATTHLILLGPPGAGKTTSLKQVASRLLTSDEFLPSRNFPLLIELRALNDGYKLVPDPLLAAITRVLGISIEIPKDVPPEEQRSELKILRERIVTACLGTLKPLILIDGFDELADATLRAAVYDDLTRLATFLEPPSLIVTSRTGEFRQDMPMSSHFELASLDDKQINGFALAWLGQDKARDFALAVTASPFADTTIRPLTLSLLCTLYERQQSIPERPKTVYRSIVKMLLEDWDQQRRVQRSSRYGSFTQDKKFDFLCELSYTLTMAGHVPRFSHEALIDAYRIIGPSYGLAYAEGLAVIDEIESHTGLMFQVGLESFEFAHKSIQEYLTAEFIVRLPAVPAMATLTKAPHETAVAISLSSNPSTYLAEVVLRRGLAREGASSVGVVPSWRIPGTERFRFLTILATRLMVEKPEFRSSHDGTWSLIILCSVLMSDREAPQSSTTARQFSGAFTPLFRADRSVFNNFYLRESTSSPDDSDHAVVYGLRPTPLATVRGEIYDLLPLQLSLPRELSQALSQ